MLQKKNWKENKKDLGSESVHADPLPGCHSLDLLCWFSWFCGTLKIWLELSLSHHTPFTEFHYWLQNNFLSSDTLSQVRI